VGIPMRMVKLTRLRHAQQRIVRVQRRVWLAQILMWPTVIAAAEFVKVDESSGC
jgi:hypothetical protein